MWKSDLDPETSRGLITVLIVFALSAFLLGVQIPVLPLFFSERGASATEIGVLTALHSSVEGGFEGVWGRLADSVSLAPLLTGRFVALAALVYLYTYVSGFGPLLALQVLRGIAEAALWPAGRAYVSRILPARRRGFGLAIVQTAIISGLSLGALAGGLLKDSIGFEPVFAAVALLFLTGSVFTIAGGGALKARESDSGSVEAAGEQGAVANPLSKLGLLALIGTLTSLGWGMTLAFVPLLGTTVLGLQASQVGAAVSIAGLSSLIVLIPAGRLSDKVGRTPVILGGLLLYSTGIAAYGIAEGLTTLLACSVAAAVGRAMTLPATLALLSEVVPFGSQGRAMGAFGVGEAVGFLFGPSAGGVIWDNYGPRVSFYAMGAAMGIGTILTVGLIREKQWLAGRTNLVLQANTPVEIGQER